MKKMSDESGQSLVEVLIGLSIIAVGISFAVILSFGGRGAALDKEDTLEAQNLASEGIEGTRAIVRADWNGISDGTYGIEFSGGSWQLAGSSTSHHKFTRQVEISTVAPSERLVTSTVTWKKRGGVQRKVVANTRLTNWGPIAKGCGLSGDWSNPVKVETLGLEASLETTDLAVSSGFVYLTSQPELGAVEDLYIWDTNADPSLLKSSIDTGEGLEDVEVRGDYAYVVGSDDKKEFQIVDISDPSSPSIVSTHDWPRSSDNLTIDVQGDYAYIGSEAGGGPDIGKHELRIIDISNPSNPSVAGSAEIDKDINELNVDGDYVYLAMEYDEPEMKVYDISDLDGITSVQSVDEDGIGVGKSLDLGMGAVNSGWMYFGRSRDTSESKSDANEEELLVMDITNPENDIDVEGDLNLPDTVSEIRGVCDLTFLGVKDSSQELTVVDTKDPASPSTKTTMDLTSEVTGIEYESNTVYASLKTGDALVIITSS